MNAPITFHLEDEVPETLSGLADELLESVDGQLDSATERLVELAEETETLAKILISHAARDVLRRRLRLFRSRLRETNGQTGFAPVVPALPQPCDALPPVPQRGVPSLPPMSPLRLATMKELAMTNWMKYPLPLKGQPPLGSAYRAQLEQSIDVHQRNIRTQTIDARWYRLIIERIGANRVEDALTEETLAELHAQAT